MPTTELLAIAAPSAQAAAVSQPVARPTDGQGKVFSAVFHQADTMARRPEPVERSSSSPRLQAPGALRQPQAQTGQVGRDRAGAKPVIGADIKSADEATAKPAEKGAAGKDSPTTTPGSQDPNQAAGNPAPAENVAAAYGLAGAAIALATLSGSGGAEPSQATASQQAAPSPVMVTSQAAESTPAAFKTAIAVAGSTPLGPQGSSLAPAAGSQAATTSGTSAAKASPPAAMPETNASPPAAMPETKASPPAAMPEANASPTAATPATDAVQMAPTPATKAAQTVLRPATKTTVDTTGSTTVAGAPKKFLQQDLPAGKTPVAATMPADQQATSAGPGAPGGKAPPLIVGEGTGAVTQITATDGARAGSQTNVRGPKLQDLTLADLAVKHVLATGDNKDKAASGSGADACVLGGPAAPPAANSAPGAAGPATTPLRQTLVDQVQQAATTGNSGIKMVLHPESLGTVHLHVQVRDGAVNAVIKVDNPDVGHAITHQLDILRQSFENQGIKIDRLEVNVSSDNSGQGASATMNFASGDQQQQQQSPHAGPQTAPIRYVTFGADSEASALDPAVPVWAAGGPAMAHALDLQA